MSLAPRPCRRWYRSRAITHPPSGRSAPPLAERVAPAAATASASCCVVAVLASLACAPSCARMASRRTVSCAMASAQSARAQPSCHRPRHVMPYPWRAPPPHQMSGGATHPSRIAPAPPSAPSLSPTVRISGSSGLGGRCSLTARSRCVFWCDCTFTRARPPWSCVTRVSLFSARGPAHLARRLLCTTLHSALRRLIAVATRRHAVVSGPPPPVPPWFRIHSLMAPGANAPQPPCCLRHCCSHHSAPSRSSAGCAPLSTRAIAFSAAR